LLGQLAPISPEQIVTRESRSRKLRIGPHFQLQRRTEARATLGLTRLIIEGGLFVSPPEGCV
jgi:hypothetical protein